MPRFYVQMHDASHLHYDFRLQIGSVLKSWAVPKGPSIDPKQKRLAVLVDDHDLSYANFEGIIAEGYGKGTVLLWDRGTFKESGDLPIDKAFKKGHLEFELKGKKLKGGFHLIRTKRENQWLLFKKKDDFASVKDILKENKSVKSNKTIKEIKTKKTVKK